MRRIVNVYPGLYPEGAKNYSYSCQQGDSYSRGSHIPFEVKLCVTLRLLAGASYLDMIWYGISLTILSACLSASFSVSLPVTLPLSLSLCLSLCLFLCVSLPASLFAAYLPACLLIYLASLLSAYPPVYLLQCLNKEYR
jgi:hypothetical protein